MPFDTSLRAPVQVEFRGRTGEWFGIWMTNLLLSIVTLGIYSAWAKVRRQKYFYQHTYVAGRNFDYHATGGQILKGRLVVLVGYIVFTLLSAVPILSLVMLAGLLLLVPYLIVRALRFNAAVSSWSNVRFRFTGRTRGAFLAFLVYPFLAALTLFVAWPFASRALRRFSIGHHHLGAAPLAFSAPIGPFYVGFAAAIAWLLAVGAAIALVAVTGLGGTNALSNPDDPQVATAIVLGIYAFLLAGVVPAATVYGAFIRNAVINGTTIDGKHRLHSDISPARLIWIVLSNAAAAILTLGLLLPWAHIRLARYFAEHTRLIPAGPSTTSSASSRRGQAPSATPIPISKGSSLGSRSDDRKPAGAVVLRGRAYAAGRSRGEVAELRVANGRLELVGADGRRLAGAARGDLRFDAPIGSAPRRATLPDGTLFETGDHDAVAKLTGPSAGGLLHRAERFHPWLALVVLACLGAGWLVWRYALDLVVVAAVALTPQPLVTAIDRGALRSVDMALAAPTTLPDTTRAEAEAVFRRLVAALDPEDRAGRDFRIEFRDMPRIGPNAFALPGGTVVVTDALLSRFGSADVRAGVLAHEIGHVVEEHGLRQLYRSLGISALVSLMAGETGPVLEEILLEGNVLLALPYSRAHERRADAFGLGLADAAGYDPAGLLRFFERLDDGDAVPAWTSTHPSSAERIAAIRAWVAAH